MSNLLELFIKTGSYPFIIQKVDIIELRKSTYMIVNFYMLSLHSRMQQSAQRQSWNMQEIFAGNGTLSPHICVSTSQNVPENPMVVPSNFGCIHYTLTYLTDAWNRASVQELQSVGNNLPGTSASSIVQQPLQRSSKSPVCAR